MGKSNRKRFESMCRKHGLWTYNSDYASLVVYKQGAWEPLADIPWYEFKDPDWEKLQEILTSCVLLATFEG
jgi:hypothetical protein